MARIRRPKARKAKSTRNPRRKRRAAAAAGGELAGDRDVAGELDKNVVEVQHLGGITYQLRYVACGKPACKRCRGGAAHGPYWYAFWLSNGRTRSKYIGKQLPVAVHRLVDVAKHVDARGAAHAVGRDVLRGQYEAQLRAAAREQMGLEPEL